MIDDNEILKEIKQAVLQVDSEADVLLFGSRARGDFHEESDWDVLVLMDKEESDYEFKSRIRDALYSLELKLGEVISGVIRNRVFWEKLNATPFYWEVQKDGKIL